MDNIYTRSEMLFGLEGMENIKNAHVAVFGVGGVGASAAEALVRGGVGEITLVDGDVVAPSNLNRQAVATSRAVGEPKVYAMRERLLDINPLVKVNAVYGFFTPDNAGDFDFSSFDYILDAIDSVNDKTELIVRAKSAGTPIVSSMGAGNKLHPELLELSDIYKTQVCPLARVMRAQLRKRGVEALTVVYSREEPVRERGAGSTPGSCSFVPPAAGLILAGEILRSAALKK